MDYENRSICEKIPNTQKLKKSLVTMLTDLLSGARHDSVQPV